MDLDNLKSVYFIGIGGIGMSALARYFNFLGIKTKGYDKTETILTKKLVSEGIDIHYEEAPESIPDHVDLVVYTPAIPATNLELQFVRKKGIKLLKRAEVLGMISRNKPAIAVAGTHGKTTTSTLITHLLRSGGVDCTAFLGGISVNVGGNFVQGMSDWVVVEADEYDRSFLHLEPSLSVITSLDADHLDIYGDESSILETGFKAFIRCLQKEGTLLLCNGLDEKLGSEDVLKAINWKSYGIENGAFKATNIEVREGAFYFDFLGPEVSLEGLMLPLPGRHNVENAVAAISVALTLGVDPDKIKPGLASFKGIKRRFERVFQSDKVTYIDDYAHHPTELKAAIGAAQELFPGKKLLGVFQPHLFTRTRDFEEGFVRELEKLDAVALLPIYPAREEPIAGVSSKMIFEKMKHDQKFLIEKAEVIKLIESIKPDVILTLGAGDIDQLVEPIKSHLDYGKE